MVGKYRSKFEGRVAEQIRRAVGPDFSYESHKIRFVRPAVPKLYTPDFILWNGIIIEAKGLFQPDDRAKHIWIAEQHPDLDIRFVFQNQNQRINKASKTTYADWCEKNGFLFAHKDVPTAWLLELYEENRWGAIEEAGYIKGL